MRRNLTITEFVKLSKKYDLKVDCTLEQINLIRKKHARELHPDIQSEADRSTANELLAEVNDDCDYLIAFIELRQEQARRKSATPSKSSPPPTKHAKPANEQRSATPPPTRKPQVDLTNPDITRLYVEYLHWCKSRYFAWNDEHAIREWERRLHAWKTHQSLRPDGSNSKKSSGITALYADYQRWCRNQYIEPEEECAVREWVYRLRVCQDQQSAKPTRGTETSFHPKNKIDKYRIVLNDISLRDPDCVVIYNQHLEWCVQHDPSVEEARTAWIEKFKTYLKHAEEKREKDFKEGRDRLRQREVEQARRLRRQALEQEKQYEQQAFEAEQQKKEQQAFEQEKQREEQAFEAKQQRAELQALLTQYERELARNSDSGSFGSVAVNCFYGFRCCFVPALPERAGHPLWKNQRRSPALSL